jgi:hypothetical protein
MIKLTFADGTCKYITECAQDKYMIRGIHKNGARPISAEVPKHLKDDEELMNQVYPALQRGSENNVKFV